MKNIEIDEELYQFIATNTQFIGESASSILRRLLALESTKAFPNITAVEKDKASAIKSEVAAQLEKPATETKISESEVSSSEVNEKNSVVSSAEVGSVFDLINKEELAMQRGAVGRFLLILAALYRLHNQQFVKVTGIRGRDRLYFAASESELSASGSSTKPRQIPESPYWVITNSNTTRKKMMLTEVSIALGYDEADSAKIREML
jgi:negative modulator of initiation of replication